MPLDGVTCIATSGGMALKPTTSPAVWENAACSMICSSQLDGTVAAAIARDWQRAREGLHTQGARWFASMAPKLASWLAVEISCVGLVVDILAFLIESATAIFVSHVLFDFDLTLHYTGNSMGTVKWRRMLTAARLVPSSICCRVTPTQLATTACRLRTPSDG